MQTLAVEGEKHGIPVSCLAPTAATQMTHGVSARYREPAAATVR